MCTPAIAVGAAQGLMGAMSSIAGYSAERQAAKASEKVYQQERANALRAQDVATEQNQLRLKSEYDKSAQQAEQLLVTRLQAQGSTLAAGRSGQSIGGLLTDAQRVEGKDLATLGMNLASARQDYLFDANSIFTSTKSAINQAAAQRKAGPSTAGLLLGIGQAGISGATTAASLGSGSGEGEGWNKSFFPKKT
jgi:hypothetical protein